jgi:hypothetical protein
VPFRRDVPGDPTGIADAHDILSAEEYPPPGGPDADTARARARRLPPDPAGIESAHDVLAAEEFPPPAHADWLRTPASPGGPPIRVALLAGAAGLVAGALLARRGRR